MLQLTLMLENTLTKLNNQEEALNNYEIAIKLRPNFFHCHCNMGVILTKLDRHENAVKAFKRALEIRPCCPRTNRNLGFVLSSLGKDEEALKYLDKANWLEARDAGDNSEPSLKRINFEVLPIQTVSKEVDDLRGNPCTICTSDYVANEEVVILPCLHKYHKVCAKLWLQNKAICPLCRTKVDV